MSVTDLHEHFGVPLVQPFAHAAPGYLSAGWWPLPAADGKAGIPAGFTGHDGRPVSAADVERWVAETPGANVALRLPPDVVAVDVDAYSGKPGAATLAELEERLGALPATVAATARPLPSGKYLYRVPNGTRLRSTMGPGIDVCQHHHRYVIVAPSVHHSGATVHWIDTASGEVLEHVPEPDDIPALPWPWLEEFSITGSGEVGAAVDHAGVREWVGRTEHAGGRPAWLDAVAERVERLVTAGESRHDTMLGALCQVAREAEAGAYPADSAVTRLRALWDRCTAGEDRAAEFDDLVAWAVGQAATSSGQAAIAEKRAKLQPLHAVELAPGTQPGVPAGEAATSPAIVDPLTGLPVAAELLEQVLFEVFRDDARRIARSIVAEREWTPVPPLVTLRQAIDQAPEQQPARIERVLPANGRAVIVAPKKTGKSTLVLNVVKAVATGGQLFDRWRTRPGRVAVLNYEVLAEQWATWCAEADIPLDDSLVLSLRGQPNPLATVRGRTELAAQLRDHGVDVLIVDPFGQASRGVVDNENSNSEVREFTGLLDDLAAEAGVAELVLPVHAGKFGEDARGASALEDWPDAIWTLVKDDDGHRYFYATGRDVDVPESMLQFNPQNRRLSFTAQHANRASAKGQRAAADIEAFLADHPGAKVGEVHAHLEAQGHDVGKSGTAGKWLADLARAGRVVQVAGERNSKRNYLPHQHAEVAA